MNEKNGLEKFKDGFAIFIKSPMGRVVLSIVLYVVDFLILYLTVPFGSILMAYFGWKALNRITPDIFLIMPLSSWLWYFLIKGILAILVGMFVAPYQITKAILVKVG